MTVTFLGTGTSQGVPVIACNCKVCQSVDSRDKRLRTSILLTIQNQNYAIDTGPDFRYQMLREGVQHLEGILFTHEHKDHIAGLDDVRAFNHKQDRAIPIYASSRVLDALKREFYYAFTAPFYPGVPKFEIHELSDEKFLLENKVWVTPLEVLHYKLPVMGFRIGNFAYITDMKTISAIEMEKLTGLDVLVINALQREPHISHLTLPEALEFASQVNAKQTYLTHISHRLGLHADVQLELPDNVFLAYDGMRLTLS